MHASAPSAHGQALLTGAHTQAAMRCQNGMLPWPNVRRQLCFEDRPNPSIWSYNHERGLCAAQRLKGGESMTLVIDPLTCDVARWLLDNLQNAVHES
jgi:hypothetical protein